MSFLLMLKPELLTQGFKLTRITKEFSLLTKQLKFQRKLQTVIRINNKLAAIIVTLLTPIATIQPVKNWLIDYYTETVNIILNHNNKVQTLISTQTRINSEIQLIKSIIEQYNKDNINSSQI